MRKREKVSQILQLLSLQEQAELLKAHRDYKVRVHYIDPSMFPSRLDDLLADAAENGDPKRIIRSGARDVVSTVIDVMDHEESAKLRPFLEYRLSAELFAKLGWTD